MNSPGRGATPLLNDCVVPVEHEPLEHLELLALDELLLLGRGRRRLARLGRRLGRRLGVDGFLTSQAYPAPALTNPSIVSNLLADAS